LTGARLRIALLAAAAVLLAGCGGGGGPHLARQDAAQLIALADRISREAPCAQARDIRALSALTISLINADKVPAELQEPLSSGANALVAQTPACRPSVPAATVTPTTTVPQHGKQDKHGKKHKGKD
jgi:hypothetical protein